MDKKDSISVGTDPPSMSVQELQATLFPPLLPALTITESTYNLQRLSSEPLLSSLLYRNVMGDDRPESALSRFREPRDLFAIGREQLSSAQQAPRWPTECQVLSDKITHNGSYPPLPELYYIATGKEPQPKPLGEECGVVVFDYNPTSALNYFTRSSVGGSNYTPNLEEEYNECDLQFESRFESGNLAKAIKITSSFYELYVRTDMYTNRHTQWFYFQISNVKRNINYRFSIVNLSKGDSLYGQGMRPLMYSTKSYKQHSVGWRRCGQNIAYFCNENSNVEEDQPSTYTLTFTLEFPHDGDVVYLAHSYPYTYTDLQNYLTYLINNPYKNTFSSLRLLCRSLAGNNIYYITITSPNPVGDIKKKVVVLTARVHPGEAPSSWMMKGLLDFLTSDTSSARELRNKFIFKIIPMLNPDGVIVGNSRCSLLGRDLNRQYRTVIREMYPSIWHTKLMIRRLIEECGVALYCDFHAHSRQNNIFLYGCENRKGTESYLQEQVFPLMLHKNAADKFSFENCRFRVQKAKEGTGRVVMWMMGIANSYTLEASFAGSDIGLRADTHFGIVDYEQMGRTFCQTLLDYYDDSPQQEKLRYTIFRKLLKHGSTADEPINVNISDYSSDEGDSSSPEDEDKDNYIYNLKAPPSSPNYTSKPKKKKAPVAIKNTNKSPIAQRKTLPMYQTNIELSLEDTDSIENENKVTSATMRKPTTKIRKVVRKKKHKKVQKGKVYGNVHVDNSDAEYPVKNAAQAFMSVFELFPDEKVATRSWDEFNYKFFRTSSKDLNYQTTKTTEQLTEVQARLLHLRRKIWSTANDGDYEPLSWGYSNYVNLTSKKKNKDATANEEDKIKKGQKLLEDERTEKKSKKKVKKHTKEEPKKKEPKKKSNGIKRQPAVELNNFETRHQKSKSRSLPETLEPDVPQRPHTVGDNFGNFAKQKDAKKKKKQPCRENWERKINIANLNAFVRS